MTALPRISKQSRRLEDNIAQVCRKEWPVVDGDSESGNSKPCRKLNDEGSMLAE